MDISETERFLQHLESAEADARLREKMQTLADMMAQAQASDAQMDMQLAKLVDGEPEHIRSVIVDALQKMVRAKEEEKKRAIETSVDAQKKELMEAERGTLRLWLAWLMSDKTLKKMRLSLLGKPALNETLHDIGQDLAKKGVLQTSQAVGKQELGGLSNTIVPSKDKSTERGR